MSKIEVDQVDPQSGTTLTLGTSGDTVSIPSGVTLANAGTVTGIPTSALTGTIGTSQIADDAVTLAKMAPGTDGNIISYDASGNPVAVATGTAGQVLTSAGAGAPPTFAAASGGTNTPNFEVKKSSGQTLSDNTWTKMTFQSETFDSDSAFDLSNDKFTVPSGEGGKYFLYASILWNGDDRGYRRVGLYKNGSLEKVLTTTHTNSYDGAGISAGALLNLSASDYIEVYAGSFNNGDPEDVEGDANASYFGGFKLIE